MVEIEIAPTLYKYCSYDEAVLYCQFLEHNKHKDWRLPSSDEWSHNSAKFLGCWWDERTASSTRLVTPVRSIN